MYHLLMGYLMTVIFIKTVIIIPIVLDLEIEAQTVYKGFFFSSKPSPLIDGHAYEKDVRRAVGR